MSERLAYSLAEAAQLSSLSVRSLRYLMQQGKLGFAKVGRRILVPHVELERLLRRASVKPTQTIDADEPIRPRGENTKTRAAEPGSSDVRSGGTPQLTPDQETA